MADLAPGFDTRPSLMLRIRQGDADAWRTFVHVYGPWLYHRCRKAGLGQQDAEDVIQNVFTKLLMAQFDYQPERGSFRGWLNLVLRQQVADLFRRRARDGQGTGGLSETDWIERFPAREENSAETEELQACLFRLARKNVQAEFPEWMWQVFDAVWLEHRSPADVAAEMGRKVSSLHEAKSRVLKRIREEFNRLAADTALLADAVPFEENGRVKEVKSNRRRETDP